MKIKVLQVVGSLGLGGNEIFAMNLYRNIDKEKFQVDFVVFDGDRLDFYDEIVDSGGKVFICKSKSKNNIKNFIERLRQVRYILKHYHYDIIHCHSCSFLGILNGALPGSMTKNTKVITHAHNPGTPKNTLIDDVFRTIMKMLISRMADYGFSCSDVAGESKYTKRFIKSNKYYIINNAIDVDEYLYNFDKRNLIRNKLNIKTNEYVIGHVGRFEYQKNHRFLIDIFEKIYIKNNNCKLMLIGDGSMFEEIKQYSKEKKLYDSIVFLGQLDSAADYYNVMDCFLLPSFYEGFPFVLVEAQINGLNCVISNSISKSVNVSGKVKFITLEASADEWANSVLENCKKRLEKEDIDKVKDKYDLKKEIKKIENLYIKAMKMR